MDRSIRKIVCFFVYCVILQGQISTATEKWTCTTTTDLFKEPSCTKLEARVTDLEEKVKRLENSNAAAETTVAMQTSTTMSTTANSTPMSSNCEAIYGNGKRNDSVYDISPDGQESFPVYCDMTNGGWTLIQNRIIDSVPFNRTWSDYETGFGDLQGSHWLGLEKIHRLTRNGSQIRFDMELVNGSKVYAQYNSFRVEDASTAYTMHVNASGYSGSIPELLSFHDGMKFSTFDRDNDANVGSHCSQSLGYGGWWYNDCYRLGNLNGQYGIQNPTGFAYYDNNMFWYLKTASIKVKGL